MDDFKLIRPTINYASRIAEYRQEFLDKGDTMDGCGSLRTLNNPFDYIKKCEEYENIETLPTDKVLATQFLFVREKDDKIIGMIQIRHYFNDYLSKYGGHIGYSIRPSERRKGYSKIMLKSALIFCREIGLKRVLITCIDKNIASEHTIISNGGVYESTIFEPFESVKLKRYWINL